MTRISIDPDGPRDDREGEDEQMLQRLFALRPDMEKCFRCSLCKMVPLPVVKHPRFTDACPAARHFHFHGYSGSGKSIMALSLLDGRIEADADLARSVFACTACGYCDVACKFIMDAERHRINMSLRELLYAHGESPFERQERTEEDRSAGFTEDHLNSIRGLPGVNKDTEKADTIIFVGCGSAGTEKELETAGKLARILAASGMEVAIMGGIENCCGLPLYWKGDRAGFIKAATRVSSQIQSQGTRKVIVTSGSCFGIMRSKYPEYGVKIDAEIVHATEVLDELLARGELNLKKEIKARASYHDPCYLGRQSEPFVEDDSMEKTALNVMTYHDPPRQVSRGTRGVYDPPRSLISSVPGIEFRELYRVREYSFCCGGGGGVPGSFPELAESAALHRLEEAKEVGAEVLVTACGHCRTQFEKAQQKLDPKERVRIIDVVDLVYEAMGLEG